MRATIIATASFGLSALAAAPAEPPRWDIAAICTRIGGTTGSDDSRAQCRREQGSAYDEARKDWATYPEDLRGRCGEEAGLGNQPS